MLKANWTRSIARGLILSSVAAYDLMDVVAVGLLRSILGRAEGDRTDLKRDEDLAIMTPCFTDRPVLIA